MSKSIKRAQVYLTNEQFQRVTQLARKKHTSFAHLVREAVDEFLRNNHAKWDHDPITRHVGSLRGKERDLSVNHDHYLFGE